MHMAMGNLRTVADCFPFIFLSVVLPLSPVLHDPAFASMPCRSSRRRS